MIRANAVEVATGHQARCRIEGCHWLGKWHATYQQANQDRQAHLQGHRDAETTGERARCPWWSDPSDDFYGQCVKEAYHDREGDDEHENKHGIRWTGQRWEGAS